MYSGTVLEQQCVVEYVIVNNVGSLEAGGEGKPMYTPSDAFLSVPEVATMMVGDVVKMAKAYKNPSATEDEPSYLFATCDGLLGDYAAPV